MSSCRYRSVGRVGPGWGRTLCPGRSLGPAGDGERSGPVFPVFRGRGETPGPSSSPEWTGSGEVREPKRGDRCHYSLGPCPGLVSARRSPALSARAPRSVDRPGARRASAVEGGEFAAAAASTTTSPALFCRVSRVRGPARAACARVSAVAPPYRSPPVPRRVTTLSGTSVRLQDTSHLTRAPSIRRRGRKRRRDRSWTIGVGGRRRDRPR